MLFFDGGFFYVCLDQKALRHDHTFTRLETFQYFNTLCIAAAEFHRTRTVGLSFLHVDHILILGSLQGGYRHY